MEIECSICLEDLCNFVIETPCNHFFCLKCLKDWQNKEILDNLPLTCPNCRKIIPKIQDDKSILNEGYITLPSNSEEDIIIEQESQCCCFPFF
jgi:hypothetical protein